MLEFFHNGAPVAKLDRVRLWWKPEGRAIRPRKLTDLSKMYFVYILRSEKTKRHYVGFASDPLQRLGQHNSGITKSTKGRGPWAIVHQEQFATRSEAIRRERFLKTGQGREELKRLLTRIESDGKSVSSLSAE